MRSIARIGCESFTGRTTFRPRISSVKLTLNLKSSLSQDYIHYHVRLISLDKAIFFCKLLKSVFSILFLDSAS